MGIERLSIKRVFHRMKFIPIVVAYMVMVLTSVSFGETILIIREKGVEFEDVSNVIKSELSTDFEVNDLIISKKSGTNDVCRTLEMYKPKLVVLIDNVAVNLFIQYQTKLGDSVPYVPSLALMGVLIEDAIQDLKNAAGITYEIPAVSAVLGLQSVMFTKISRIGVIHRDFCDKFINWNKEVCFKKGLQLFSRSLPNKSSNYTLLLKEQIKDLVEHQRIECLWIPNDNVLLQPQFVKNVWIPLVNEYKIPVIVGVESLVKPELNFGAFAVLPDHSALGNQAAGMVYQIQKNNWYIDSSKVEPPLSVIKVMNYRILKEQFSIRESALRGIDRIYK
jgi:hypothetical protein